MINWKYIFYILISILLIGYIFISSKKIDNLKNQLLIEQAKNERIIDSLYLVKNSIVYKDVPISNTMINSVETLKSNLCAE